MNETITPTLPSPEVLRALLDKLPAGGLGDLGERLRKDKDGTVCAQYRHAFEAAIDKSTSRLARPLPDAEFVAARATIDACTQARGVLEVVWAALQGPGTQHSGP
jgi:hypothetical protein